MAKKRQKGHLVQKLASGLALAAQKEGLNVPKSGV
jgi:hypothetical protein